MKFTATLFRRLLRLLTLTAALAAAIFISACASLDGGRATATSSIPIEVVQSGSGHVLSFRARESGSRLYVSGTAREQPLTTRTHVDVQLLSSSGNVIAEKRDDIDPQHPAAGGGRRTQGAFVASFPLSEARQAARILITYHAQHP